MIKMERGLYINPENVTHVVEATPEKRMAMSNPQSGFTIPPVVRTFIYMVGNHLIMSELTPNIVLQLLQGTYYYDQDGKLKKT